MDNEVQEKLIGDYISKSYKIFKESPNVKPYTKDKPQNKTNAMSPKQDIELTNVTILKQTTKQAEEVGIILSKEYEEKKKWRYVIIRCLLFLLFGLFLLLVYLVKIEYSTNVAFTLIGAIIVNLISVLLVFIKFSTDNKYTDTYKEIITKQLEYISNFYDNN